MAIERRGDDASVELEAPVCGSCTMILRELGFRPAGSTKFRTEKSGGVSWGGNMKVQALVQALGKSGIYARAEAAGAK